MTQNLEGSQILFAIRQLQIEFDSISRQHNRRFHKMVDCIVTHNHLEEGHFAAGFTVLAQLRQEDILTDISLVPDEAKCNPVRAHKLVLMANSDYFRTMFKACFAESTSQSLLMPGKHIMSKNIFLFAIIDSVY